MGKVNLISNTWDYIARVEIREGHYQNPEQNALVFSGSVRRGQSFLSGNDVQQCYRRSNDPSSATSPLGSWNCNTKIGSGVENWSLR